MNLYNELQNKTLQELLDQSSVMNDASESIHLMSQKQIIKRILSRNSKVHDPSSSNRTIINKNKQIKPQNQNSLNLDKQRSISMHQKLQSQPVQNNLNLYKKRQINIQQYQQNHRYYSVQKSGNYQLQHQNISYQDQQDYNNQTIKGLDWSLQKMDRIPSTNNTQDIGPGSYSIDIQKEFKINKWRNERYSWVKYNQIMAQKLQQKLFYYQIPLEDHDQLLTYEFVKDSTPGPGSYNCYNDLSTYKPNKSLETSINNQKLKQQHLYKFDPDSNQTYYHKQCNIYDQQKNRIQEKQNEDNFLTIEQNIKKTKQIVFTKKVSYIQEEAYNSNPFLGPGSYEYQIQKQNRGCYQNNFGSYREKLDYPTYMQIELKAQDRNYIQNNIKAYKQNTLLLKKNQLSSMISKTQKKHFQMIQYQYFDQLHQEKEKSPEIQKPKIFKNQVNKIKKQQIQIQQKIDPNIFKNYLLRDQEEKQVYIGGLSERFHDKINFEIINNNESLNLAINKNQQTQLFK